jgi:hypothetical protein
VVVSSDLAETPFAFMVKWELLRSVVTLSALDHAKPMFGRQVQRTRENIDRQYTRLARIHKGIIGLTLLSLQGFCNVL